MDEISFQGRTGIKILAMKTTGSHLITLLLPFWKAKHFDKNKYGNNKKTGFPDGSFWMLNVDICIIQQFYTKVVCNGLDKACVFVQIYRRKGGGPHF